MIPDYGPAWLRRPCFDSDVVWPLDNATRPFVLALADKGFPRVLIDDVHLQNGLNVHDGKVTCRAVADALRLPYTAAVDILR